MAARVRQIRGTWWLVVHYKGHRWKEHCSASRRVANEVAERIQAEIKLGKYERGRVKEEVLPLAQFAEEWHRREIALPLERGHEGHVAPGSAEIYALQIRVHSGPLVAARSKASMTIAWRQDDREARSQSRWP